MTMRTVKLKSIEDSDKVGLYSICFDEGSVSEFENFMLKFMNDKSVNRDYQRIIFALKKILSVGVLERFFRPEGKIKDRTCALSIDSRQLRLYCLRLSDQILILGNGGVKTTATYQEDDELCGYVCDLQEFDRVLKRAQEKGKIYIEQTVITNIDTATFNLQ